MSIFRSTKHSENCPQCGAVLQLKRGKKGLFLGCSAYPACDYIKPIQQSSRIIKDLDEICPECGHFLQLKQGNFGMFIGCSHYPECHFTVHNQEEKEKTFDCPECYKGKLVKRTARNGKSFYGCTNYPQCKFTLSGNIEEQTCPQCGCNVAIVKSSLGTTRYQCAAKNCQHIFTLTQDLSE